MICFGPKDKLSSNFQENALTLALISQLQRRSVASMFYFFERADFGIVVYIECGARDVPDPSLTLGGAQKLEHRADRLHRCKITGSFNILYFLALQCTTLLNDMY